MWRTRLCFGLCLAGLLPLTARAADKPLSPADETAAEQLRKALDQVRDVEIADLPLDRAVNQLREQIGINLVIDQAAMPQGQPAFQFGNVAVSFENLRVRGQFHGVPFRTALTKLLRDHNLTHVLVGDTVFITPIDKAADRQLGQSVSVHVEGTPLREELKRLARETGANIVLDPHAAKKGQTALMVRLDEVPLETAVEVLADEAGLRAVRLHNVLYVTTEARAEKLRKPRPAPAPGWRVWPDGSGGFRLTPPGGAGIGGGGGITGFQGGVLGMAGGVAPPVPLTPPVPKAKPAEPEKPAQKTPPAKPAVQPDGKDKPAPKNKPQAQAIPPDSRSPRSRRGTHQPLGT